MCGSRLRRSLCGPPGGTTPCSLGQVSRQGRVRLFIHGGRCIDMLPDMAAATKVSCPYKGNPPPVPCLCVRAGAGLVRMGPGVREVYPAWWSDPGLTGGREEGGPGC